MISQVRQIGERRGAGRLDDHVLPASSAGPSLLPINETGKVPRHNRTANAQGFAQYQAMAAGVEHDRAGAHGFGHAAVVIQSMHEAADFQDRLAHRFALLFGQQGGELFFPLQNRVAGGQQNRAPFGRRHGGPFLERAFGGVDGAPDIFNGSFGNAVDRLLRWRDCGLGWFRPLSESTCSLAISIFAMGTSLDFVRTSEKIMFIGGSQEFKLVEETATFAAGA